MAAEQTASSPLERRLQRLAVLIPAFAIAAAIFGMLPNGVAVYCHSWKHDTDTFDHLTHAGGWTLVVWALLQVLAARPLRTMNSRRKAVQWFVVSLLVYASAAIVWFVENVTFETQVMRWPAELTAACAGSACVLVFIVLPAVLLASGAERPSDAPSARVVEP